MREDVLSIEIIGLTVQNLSLSDFRLRGLLEIARWKPFEKMIETKTPYQLSDKEVKAIKKKLEQDFGTAEIHFPSNYSSGTLLNDQGGFPITEAQENPEIKTFRAKSLISVVIYFVM